MELFLLLPVLLFSVVVHEYAHGWVALRQGDPTAQSQGRLTLNPIVHIDLFGSIIFPLLLWVMNVGFLFGWARPVPVDPRNFRDYRRGDILVSLAGVAANLLLAVACVLLMIVLVHVARLAAGGPALLDAVHLMLSYGLVINLILAFFNLIPIPPLDGSHVLYHLLPPSVGARYRELGRYGMLILLAILFFAPGALGYVLRPVTALQGLAESLVRFWT